MASSPRFKVYRGGEYVAACKYAEDAAAIIAMSSSGVIKDGHARVVWEEGKEEQPAGESYDFVAQTIHARTEEVSR